MTNLVEILKNAPKGLELYSPLYGKVKFCGINTNVRTVGVEYNNTTRWFDEYGCINENSECLLFPSKENREWDNWQKTLFKEGHYITYIGKYTLITSKVPKRGFPKEDDYLGSRFATKREIEIYNQYNNKEIIHNIEDKPFTIDDFKPFDKVLGFTVDGWEINLFSNYAENNTFPYICLTDCYRNCIPYNDETKHLLGTTKEYNGKYKTW